jgi:hypothetical protein
LVEILTILVFCARSNHKSRARRNGLARDRAVIAEAEGNNVLDRYVKTRGIVKKISALESPNSGYNKQHARIQGQKKRSGVMIYDPNQSRLQNVSIVLVRILATSRRLRREVPDVFCHLSLVQAFLLPRF